LPKVCYISPISIHSVRYLEEFHRRDYETSIIADSQTWVATRPQSIPVYLLPPLTRRNFPYRYISSIQTAMRILGKIKPDFVHLHAQHYYSPAMILSDIPFILTSWGTEVLTLPSENILIKTSSKIAATKASKITVDANCLKAIWMRFGIPANKVEVIPFGVDLNIFNPKVDGSEVRQALGIQSEDIVLISTRALHNHHYNVESFIQAMPSILKSCSNVKFIIKGTGPLEAHLKNLVTKLSLSDYVRFVGLVPHSQMANYLAAADIYVSTCFVDTTSVSLLEAMACGLAPIVTDIVGNREWITDGVNGLLFPRRSPQALAGKAIKLIKNEDLRKRFGERCFQTVKQRASWTESVSKMERVYESTIRSRR
jgi:glycosyltransferase involved in cell wall biosynthesis